MKRVVIFGVKTFPSRGGTDRVAENLILQLKDRFHFTLYCYKDPKAEDFIPGISVIQFEPLLKGGPGVFLYFFLAALHLLFRVNADIVHVHKIDSAFFIPLLRLRYKVIATSHESPYKRDKWNHLERVYFRATERLFIKFSNVCTSISQPLASYYQNKYKKDILFIPNGINPVNTETLDFEKSARFLPEGASLDEPFVLFSARRIMKTKGCHTMLEALAKMGYKGQVFIAGELTHNANYLEALRKTGKSLNMHFLGFVNELDSLLALVLKSQLFIFPSETEGMSIMLLEVASVGKAIIASDIPENYQVFSAEEVLYFRVSNSDDLADKISYALSNKLNMEILGKRCRQKVYRDFVWSNIASLYEKAYNEAMKN